MKKINIQLRSYSTKISSSFDKLVDRTFTSSVKIDRYAINRDSPSCSYRDVIPMWVADMDFEAPPLVQKTLQNRISNHPVFGYTGPDFKVKDAVLSYLSEKHKISNVNAEHLVFLPGLVVGLNLIARMAKNMNKAVMTSTPIYPPFMTSSQFNQTELVTVPLVYHENERQYKMDFDTMETMVSKHNVGFFLLCNPHNPVGKVFSKEELETLAKFCEKHDLYVLSDEIHCDLVLDPSQKHLSFMNMPGMHDRTILFHAPSKTYNLAGLGSAFAVIPNVQLRSRFKTVTRGIMADVNIFGYLAMQTVYEDRDGSCEAWRQELVHYLWGNVRTVKSFLENNTNSLLTMSHDHQATYLLWINARPLAERLLQTQSAHQWFEQQAKIGLNDGVVFGPSPMYRDYVRMNVGCSRATVEKALEGLDRALREL